MTRYALKDKARQERLDALCKVEKFSEQLQDACREHLGNNANFVNVHFGKIALENVEGGKYYFSEFNVRILKSDIEVIEDLKPYVWYPCEKFDGNPNGYVLVERIVNYDTVAFTICSKMINSLMDVSTHFMYIERPEVSNEF